MRHCRFVPVSIAIALLLGCGSAQVAPCPVTVEAPSDVQRNLTQRAGKDGVTLSVQRWQALAQPPKATLVLVHGLKDHGDHYAVLSARLARQGIQVVAADLRGHGRSTGERAWTEQFSDYVDDTASLLRDVALEAPDRPLFLFGHSMGGAIAALTVLDKKPVLAGLVLSAPALTPGADVSGFLISVTKMLASIAPHSKVLDLPDEKFSRDPKVVASMACDPLISHEPGPARTAAELLRSMERLGPRMAEFELPLLVLHGSADVVTNPEGSNLLVEMAKSKDKALKLFPGLYHDLWHEPEHAQVEDALLQWLAAHLPAEGTPASR